MSKCHFFVAVLISAGAFTSCGESPMALACGEFVERFDALECAEPAGIDCLQFENDPCTQPEYFTCLADQYRCELGDLVDEGPSVCLEFRQCP